MAASPRPGVKRTLPLEWQHADSRGIWQGALDDTARTLSKVDLVVVLRLLPVLVVNDFKQRYRGQALGVVWSFLNPLLTMTVLSLVFGHVFRVEVPHFPVFVLLGVIFWQFTSAGWTAATNSFVRHSALVKNAAFPRALIPTAAVLSQLLNLTMEVAVLLVLLPFFPGAARFSPALLFLPVPLVLLMACVLGAGLATAVLHPRFRDVAFLVTTVQLLLYWLTPVFYPRAALPLGMKRALAINPLTGLLEAFRGIVMKGELPPLQSFSMTAGICVVVLVLGILLFRRHSRSLADFL